jgi:CRISPR/Cas system Type II protein with McrA/HNH and RuvC-like nuclease domain
MSVGYKTKKLVWERDGGYCFYCNAKLGWNNKTVDHVIPRSKGGSNRAWNIVLSCFGCNQSKGDSSPTEEQLNTILRWKTAHELRISVEKSLSIARKNKATMATIQNLIHLREDIFKIITTRHPDQNVTAILNELNTNI